MFVTRDLKLKFKSRVINVLKLVISFYPEFSTDFRIVIDFSISIRIRYFTIWKYIGYVVKIPENPSFALEQRTKLGRLGGYSYGLTSSSICASAGSLLCRNIFSTQSIKKRSVES
jgi:hypothetical protein